MLVNLTRASKIMKSYESSTATLRMILSHPSLQRGKIEETMDAMASASADARDVEDAIKIGGEAAASEAGIDDSELEAELQALIKESEGEKEATDAIERLKAVDMHAPTHSLEGSDEGWEVMEGPTEVAAT